MHIAYVALLRSVEEAATLERRADAVDDRWPTEIRFQRDARCLLLAPYGALHRRDPSRLSVRLKNIARRTDGAPVEVAAGLSYSVHLATTATFALLTVPSREGQAGMTLLSLILSYDALSNPIDDIAVAEERLSRSPFWFELGRLCFEP